MLRLLRSADPKAGERLQSLYRDALVRFCWGYLGRLEEAEDAYQEISLKILSAESLPERFRPWMYRVARNHCLNLLRRSRGEAPGLPRAASQIHESLTGQLTRIVRDEDRARLEALVSALSDTHREVLRLRYVEGLSRGEIAEVLELTESVVKSRVYEGLKQLKLHADNIRPS